MLVKLHCMLLSAAAVKQLPSSNIEANPYTPTPCAKTPIAMASVTADSGWLNSANRAMLQPM